jgi:hypothetical protein
MVSYQAYQKTRPSPAYLPTAIFTRSPRRRIDLMEQTIGCGHASGERRGVIKAHYSCIVSHDNYLGPGTWFPDVPTFYPLIYSDSLEWVFERENVWFPSVQVQGPEVTLSFGASPDDYRWIVTWWTERKGPVTRVVPLWPYAAAISG